MPQAALVGSPVSHTMSVGAIGAAMGVLAGSSGPGLLAAAFGGFVGGAPMGGLTGLAMGGDGAVVRGSGNVVINHLPAARVLDPVSCHAGNVIAMGSNSVFTNGLPAARVTDPTTDGAVIVNGSANVFIGGGRTGAPDVPGVPPPCLMGAAAAGAPFVLPK